MPIDDLPGELQIPTRDDERDQWIRDYLFHKTDDDASPGTEPFVQGSTMADAMMPVYFDIRLVADASDPKKVKGALLKVQAEADGVPRPEADGASGAVTISASIGGADIATTDELTLNNVRYHCTFAAHYADGAQVPVAAIDKGLNTNVAAGTVMTWSSAPAGLNPQAIVFEQANGSGLSGGHDQATEDEWRDLWLQNKRQRAASGNDTDIQQLAEDPTNGVAVEKAFTFPGILGNGTTCLVFVMKPSSLTATRIPNSTQIAAVLAFVLGPLPADAGIFSGTLVAQNVDVVLRTTWGVNAEGWVDTKPWPPYLAAQAVTVQSAADATHFVLRCANGVYTAVTSPGVGQTIGFYDRTNAVMSRKRILTVSGTGPWTVVCDTAAGASDTSYIPVVNQRAMPWAESLQDLVTPIALHFQTFGPGEQKSSFFDPGKRQRRQPESPKDWPHILTLKGLSNAIDDVGAVFEYSIAEPTLPFATTVGTPAVSSNLIELGFLSAFPP